MWETLPEISKSQLPDFESHRLRIHGGWLVHAAIHGTPVDAVAQTFVPDSENAWTLRSVAWEKLPDIDDVRMTDVTLYRLEVSCGWLICTVGRGGPVDSIALTFVPDADHAWKLY